MPKFDTYDTVPVRGVETGVDINGNEFDDPILAITFAEQNKIGPNNTIVDLFTPDEKIQLNKMIKNGEFTALEAGVLRSLMSEAATLEEVGAMLGSVSRRTKGAPISKPGTLKELNRILAIVAKRSKAKFGREVDLNNIRKFKSEMIKNRNERKRAAREMERRKRKAVQEFYKNLKELRAAQKAAGLRTAKLVDPADWKPGSGDVPHIQRFAKSDKNIDTMPQFGGRFDID